MNLSILICTYNHARFLDKCLSNVIGKGEVIVVDDCSTDNTQEVLSKYKDDIVIIRNETNLNLLKSRKIAFEASTCDYVTFLDADDELLELCDLDYDFDVIQGVVKSNDAYYEESNKFFINRETITENFDPHNIRKKLDHHVWGKYIRRNILEDVYNNLELTDTFMHEDLILMSEVFSRVKSYRADPNLVYKYYIGTGYTAHKGDLPKRETNSAEYQKGYKESILKKYNHKV